MKRKCLRLRVIILRDGLGDIWLVLLYWLLELSIELFEEVGFSEKVDGTSNDNLFPLTLPNAFLAVDQWGPDNQLYRLSFNFFLTLGQRIGVDLFVGCERDVTLVVAIMLLSRNDFGVLGTEAMGYAQKFFHRKQPI